MPQLIERNGDCWSDSNSVQIEKEIKELVGFHFEDVWKSQTQRQWKYFKKFIKVAISVAILNII